MERQERVGQAVFVPRPLILRTTWGDFADKMRGVVDVDMSNGESRHFTLADHNAPTEPDLPAETYWEYSDDIDKYATLPTPCV